MSTKKKVAYWLHPVYKGFKLADVVFRPGAMAMLEKPSRMGNTLYFPDGTIKGAK